MRVPGQVVPERLGGAEHAEEPVAQRLGGDQRVQQRLPLASAAWASTSRTGRQGQVGVGGGAERVEEDGVGPHGGQLGRQQPFRRRTGR